MYSAINAKDNSVRVMFLLLWSSLKRSCVRIALRVRACSVWRKGAGEGGSLEGGEVGGERERGERPGMGVVFTH